MFKIPLEEHLAVTKNRTISYVIELCVCCLLEKGLYEEGLLRVGCGECILTIYFRQFNDISIGIEMISTKF